MDGCWTQIGAQLRAPSDRWRERGASLGLGERELGDFALNHGNLLLL